MKQTVTDRIILYIEQHKDLNQNRLAQALSVERATINGYFKMVYNFTYINRAKVRQTIEISKLYIKTKKNWIDPAESLEDII